MVYAALVAVVAWIVVTRIAGRSRPPMPVSTYQPEPSSPLGVSDATLCSMISEMVWHAYGYRPTDALVQDFASRLKDESRALTS